MSGRWSEQEFADYKAKREGGRQSARSIGQVPKSSTKRKYRNTPTVVENIRFDSAKEAARWSELRLLEKAGKIENLTRQVKFSLDVEGVHICNYVADACYDQGGEVVVEDTKSSASRTRVYRLKAKLMFAIYRIRIREHL